MNETLLGPSTCSPSFVQSNQAALAGVCNGHNWIRAVVIDEFANRVIILHQSFDVAEGVVTFWEPIEFNTFVSQIRKDGRPFGKSWQKLGNVVDKAQEFFDVG